MSGLLKLLPGDPNVVAANYANAAYEGTLGLRTDIGQLWQVQGGVWVLIFGSSTASGTIQDVANIAAMQALVVTGFLDGTHCWVRSVQRAFILTTTALGASVQFDRYTSATGGRLWIGTEHTNTRLWMQQANWFIDDAASVENTGATLGSPIPEYERRTRMGVHPDWVLGAYHYFLVGTLTTDIDLLGNSVGSTIYVHGSGVAHQGLATLYSGTIDVGTIAQNQATDVPWQITSSGIPVSWTASGLVGQRIRIVGGARDGAIAWAMKDLGTKQARVCEFDVSQDLTQALFAANFGLATPVNGDAFVVESLRAITTRIGCSIVGGSSTQVVFDGFDLSNTVMNCAGTRITFYGCRTPAAVSNPPNYAFSLACRVINGVGSIAGTAFTRILGGFVLGQAAFSATSAQYFVDHFMAQGDGTANTGITFHQTPGADNSDAASITCDVLGAFDCTFLLWLGGGRTQFDDNILLWGSNNTNTLVHAAGATVEYIGAGGVLSAAMFPATALSGDVVIGGRTSIEVFDRDLHLWTYPRALTWANILGTIPNGGFCQVAGVPRILDPSTGAKFVPTRS